MSTVHDVLSDLKTLLGDRSIHWYVFGAQAVVIFGRPRQSLDIDVTLDASPDEVPVLIADFERAGFVAQVNEPTAFVLRTRVLPVVHEHSGLPVDVVFAGPGLEKEMLERAVEVDLRGLRIPFISCEDLVATKILTGRAKDLEDVRGILARQGPLLDEERVRDVLGRLERALDRSRWRRCARRDAVSGPFFASSRSRYHCRTEPAVPGLDHRAQSCHIPKLSDSDISAKVSL